MTSHGVNTHVVAFTKPLTYMAVFIYYIEYTTMVIYGYSQEKLYPLRKRTCTLLPHPMSSPFPKTQK